MYEVCEGSSAEVTYSDVCVSMRSLIFVSALVDWAVFALTAEVTDFSSPSIDLKCSRETRCARHTRRGQLIATYPLFDILLELFAGSLARRSCSGSPTLRA